jgi:hypothetical protein
MPRTVCEVIGGLCDNPCGDGQCGLPETKDQFGCPHAYEFLMRIALNDIEQNKRRLSIFNEPSNSLILKEQKHHTPVVRIRLGVIHDNRGPKS